MMDTSSGTLKFNTSVWHFDAVRWEVSITSGYRPQTAVNPYPVSAAPPGTPRYPPEGRQQLRIFLLAADRDAEVASVEPGVVSAAADQDVLLQHRVLQIKIRHVAAQKQIVCRPG
jgi:hypothetical protein